ncbi:sigma-54-dependent Fis family transcriptional regulator [Candidatus Desulfosporosinus nitrosoreducens]|uniref:sigma-54-dependent Fis family transcriptional regulator n=1 Tax=Candidatus Desulfosporosinus nitrosoreducens TaxID=3401928 RepID=UPI00280A93AE|nr:sigma-54-dependent Fis family transcriptional regulator [Desulfosporosinus sp. PR]
MTGDITPNVTKAWEKFVTNAVIDNNIVRTEIAASWQRCHAASVNPYSGVSHLLLSQQQLAELQAKKRSLLQIARLFMTNLYQFVAGSGFIVMLSDEYGYIMDVVGDSETMAYASKLNLSKGASWIEEEVGTNGIGTALATQKPVQISGAEHYCQQVHFWTCSAAPILDYNGQVIGVLQMSGPFWKTHQHTLGMVVAAVEAIKSQIRVQLRNRNLTLLNNRLKNIMLAASDGIILTDKEGIIEQLNPMAERIFSQTEQEIKGSSIKDHLEQSLTVQKMLTTGKPYKESEIVATTLNGSLHCLSSGEPVKDDNGDISGAVIFINPINKVKPLLNRFSGTQATFQFEDIIGVNEQLLESIELAKIAAGSKSHVLLQGESGTGKEVFAQAIHNSSCRRNGPFVAINCGAIPRELIGSELFGYEGGSFTGAKSGGRPGKFEMASGGTLFLDEIGDMPLEHQVALLRVLQDKRITRIGGYNSIMMDVRIISASNKNLQAEVMKGNFRQDLFFRLNVINIPLPPLRERREDIPLLFNTFFRETCDKMGLNSPSVDSRVIARLSQYDWPGNVRELQNVIERMANLAGSQGIGLEHLPKEIIAPNTRALKSGRECFLSPPQTIAESINIKELLATNERVEIINKLLAHNGNISNVARDMGISRNSLYKKLKKLNISTH